MGQRGEMALRPQDCRQHGQQDYPTRGEIAAARLDLTGAGMAEHAQAILSGTRLSKSYGALRVLHEVDFEVFPGEVLGILGPNGAGKTTLFNMISGDAVLDSGSLEFAGVKLRSEPPHVRCHRR